MRTLTVSQAPFEYNQVIELIIDTLTNTGLGLGRVDGWVVMVPFTVPGEHVQVKISKNHKSYSEAELIDVLKPSSHRVSPGCPLFGACGGCQYQHITYESQLEWKQQQVKELFMRLGGLTVAVQSTWPSPLQYNYRSKLTPHFNTPKPKEPLHIGFLKQGTHSKIVDVQECPIAMKPINEALTIQRSLLSKTISNYKRGSTLLLRNCKEGVITDFNRIVTESIGTKIFQFIAGEFFQNNPYILKDFVLYAIDQAKHADIHYLVDVYCGVGVFAIMGSQHFKRCYGIEIHKKAVQLAKENAELNNVKNCTFVSGSADSIFKELRCPSNATSVVLDPPRCGCDALFLEQLIAFGPQRIVYVSCAPDTQARDLKVLMQAEYSILKVQPFDLFPQTRHIENIVTLEKQTLAIGAVHNSLQ